MYAFNVKNEVADLGLEEGAFSADALRVTCLALGFV